MESDGQSIKGTCENVAQSISIVDGEDEYECSIDACAICLDEFRSGEVVSWARHAVDCKHVFHTECILPWLVLNDQCPCCREIIVLEFDTDPLEDEEGASRKDGEYYIVGGLRLPEGCNKSSSARDVSMDYRFTQQTLGLFSI